MKKILPCVLFVMCLAFLPAFGGDAPSVVNDGANETFGKDNIPTGFKNIVRDKDGTAIQAEDKDGLLWLFTNEDKFLLGRAMVSSEVSHFLKEAKNPARDYDLEIPQPKRVLIIKRFLYDVAICPMLSQSEIGECVIIEEEEANEAIVRAYFTKKGIFSPALIRKWNMEKKKIEKQEKLEGKYTKCINSKPIHKCDAKFRSLAEERKDRLKFDSWCPHRLSRRTADLCEKHLSVLAEKYPDNDIYQYIANKCLPDSTTSECAQARLRYPYAY